jgi:hypothetical protein
MHGLQLFPLAVLTLVGLLTGFVKTGLPGLGIFLPAAIALAFPAKDSVGLLVMYLLTGDVIATYYYRKNADLAELKRLIPSVAIGIVIGAGVLNNLDNEATRSVIGIIVCGLLIMEVARRYHKGFATLDAPQLRIPIGIAAGIATALANAGGAIMSIYLLLMKLDKHAFMGTTAIFFLIVNGSKIPIYVQMEVIKQQYIPLFLMTVPSVLVGALIGRKFFKHASQKLFDSLILLLTAIAAAVLIIT